MSSNYFLHRVKASLYIRGKEVDSNIYNLGARFCLSHFENSRLIDCPSHLSDSFKERYGCEGLLHIVTFFSVSSNCNTLENLKRLLSHLQPWCPYSLLQNVGDTGVTRIRRVRRVAWRDFAPYAVRFNSDQYMDCWHGYILCDKARRHVLFLPARRFVKDFLSVVDLTDFSKAPDEGRWLLGDFMDIGSHCAFMFQNHI